MTTVDSVISVDARTPQQVWRLIRTAGQRVAKAAVVARERLRRPLLTTSGISCFCVAGFQISSITGFIVTGLSLLTLEWLGGRE